MFLAPGPSYAFSARSSSLLTGWGAPGHLSKRKESGRIVQTHPTKKERLDMHIAVFADLHGRLLLAFKLCARWQQETGERIDLILQAGDLGAFPSRERLDRATRAYAERDPSELGFLEHFSSYNSEVAAQLARTSCPLVFVRGNHEDHSWLDELERQHAGALFPVDAYQRVFNLKTGLPWTFHLQGEDLRVLGIGRIAPPADSEDPQQARYIQQDESARVCKLGDVPIDVLLTHHARPDFVLLERAGQTRTGSGMPEVAHILERQRPACHFFGHYGGPPQVRTDANGVTLSVKLADLHWERGGSALEAGSMGLLHWHSRAQYTFEVLDTPWLKEYTAWTWHDISEGRT
jgi:Icc-related predicted phosphoesterase